MTLNPRVVHMHDQLHAASEETDRTLRGYAAMTGATYNRVQPTPWLRELISAAQRAAIGGSVRYCSHVGGSPMPVFAAAHRLTDVSCASCFSRQGDLTAGTDEDRTCDVCRQVVDRIHPDGVGVGPLTITYGACATCLPLVRGLPAGGGTA